MIIYLAKNTLNGKCYVGQTKRTLSRRITEHKRDAKSRTSLSSLFLRAIKLHGPDVFEWEILEECIDPTDMDMSERFWIECYNSMAPNGYNLQTGGVANKTASEETRRKIGDANRGKKFSEDHKRKISEAQKGRPGKIPSAETREKMRVARLGYKTPDSTKCKLSQSKRSKSKLTWDDVCAIRADIVSTEFELADRYGVSRPTIWKIKNYRIWVNPL